MERERLEVPVVLDFLPLERGGKAGVLSDGYRPQLHFDNVFYPCQIHFEDRAKVVAGESVRAAVRFHGWAARALKAKFIPASKFALVEGTVIVATGLVRDVGNPHK